ncbi:fimbrial protein [Salmonella enterica subsp. enterica serovar Portland]|nr:fimbrial protein SteF [Salmonella enterica subsp. enterica]EEJ7234391.1 fimbrial protein [Salmonella enterica subsp. salamae]EGZ4347519.1 fimbrial protein [Salmonella enterica subsp. enterica serovar Portland]HAV1237782.1 fimbrial protein [Salmonella enterica]
MRRLMQAMIKLFYGGLLGFIAYTPLFASDNVHYSGELVAGACELVVDGDTMATVSFHSIGNGSFNANGQSVRVPFNLSLKNCHSALASGVLVTFSGTEDNTLPGFLALEATSVASGFAIGIETIDKRPLNINATQGTLFGLSEGLMTIYLQAWLQARPAEDVTPGEFSGVATVSFEYQ